MIRIPSIAKQWIGGLTLLFVADEKKSRNAGETRVGHKKGMKECQKRVKRVGLGTHIKTVSGAAFVEKVTFQINGLSCRKESPDCRYLKRSPLSTQYRYSKANVLLQFL